MGARTASRGAFETLIPTTTIGPAGPPSAAPSIDLSGEATSPRRLAHEIWRSRELLVILARKEFHVRYRRAAFGVLWALALPLLQAIVMAVIFSRVGHFRHAGVSSYVGYVLVGMAPWTYFSMAFAAGSTAVVDNTELASKVYFPRALLPLTQVATAMYGYLVTIAIVLALCPLMHVHLGARLLLLLPATLLMVALTTGFALVASSLHVYFRDVKYLVSAAMLLWLYVTPIVYTPLDAPRTLRDVIDLNPMTGLVDLFHAATVGAGGKLVTPLAVTLVWAIALLCGGLALNCRFNRVFADLL
jgi:lipopolysaccharide transport system permease protein